MSVAFLKFQFNDTVLKPESSRNIELKLLTLETSQFLITSNALEPKLPLYANAQHKFLQLAKLQFLIGSILPVVA